MKRVSVCRLSRHRGVVLQRASSEAFELAARDMDRAGIKTETLLLRTAPSEPPGQPPLPELLTTSEVAQFLRMSIRTVEGMRYDGTGPKYIKLGPGPKAKVVYLREDVEAWLEAQIRKGG